MARLGTIYVFNTILNSQYVLHKDPGQYIDRSIALNLDRRIDSTMHIVLSNDEAILFRLTAANRGVPS